MDHFMSSQLPREQSLILSIRMFPENFLCTAIAERLMKALVG